VTHQLHIIILIAKNVKTVQEGDIIMDKKEIVKEITIKGWRYTEWFQILFDIYDVKTKLDCVSLKKYLYKIIFIKLNSGQLLHYF